MTTRLKTRAMSLVGAVLALMLALSLIPVTALAESGAGEGAVGVDRAAGAQPETEAGNDAEGNGEAKGDGGAAGETNATPEASEGSEDEADDESPSAGSKMSTEAQKAYEETGEYLASKAEDLGVSNTGGEWAVIGLARGDQELAEGWSDPYLSKAAAYVQESIDKQGRLHWFKSSDNSRLIIALTSLGVDPADFAGHNLLAGLSDMDYVKQQGINGPIWALIAFDSGDYEIPVAPEGANQVTREGLVDFILARQLADGGWALSGSTADSDMTGMALQALTPYNEPGTKVAAAVEKAISCLSGIQNDDGGFSSGGDATSESASQVIVALASLGIDPDRDERFIKSANSVLDALLSYAVEGGGFAHLKGGQVDGMATEQAYYALAAVDRLKAGFTPLYDMSDVKKDEGELPPAAPGDGEDPFGPDDDGETPELLPGDGEGESAEEGKPTASGSTASIDSVSTDAAKEADKKAAEEEVDDRVAYQRSLSDYEAAASEAAASDEGDPFPWRWIAVGGAALAVLAGLGVARSVMSSKAGE